MALPEEREREHEGDIAGRYTQTLISSLAPPWAKTDGKDVGDVFTTWLGSTSQLETQRGERVGGDALVVLRHLPSKIRETLRAKTLEYGDDFGKLQSVWSTKGKDGKDKEGGAWGGYGKGKDGKGKGEQGFNELCDHCWAWGQDGVRALSAGTQQVQGALSSVQQSQQSVPRSVLM